MYNQCKFDCFSDFPDKTLPLDGMAIDGTVLCHYATIVVLRIISCTRLVVAFDRHKI